MGKTSSESKNKYNKKAYDRINVMLPKGKKEVFVKIAQSKGLSLNGYINMLLNENLKYRNANQSDDNQSADADEEQDPTEQQSE